MNPLLSIVCEINTNQEFEQDSIQNSGIKDQDPLDGLGSLDEEKFYKLDQIVFADPIEVMNNYEDNGDKETNKFKFLNKVTVEERVGKRNKYHIELDDASKTVCPEGDCNKKFSTTTLLKAHIRKVHCAVLSHTCEVCGARFTARYLLVRHMAVHERRTVQCPTCSARLSERSSLSVHMRFVHRQGALECDKCDQRFDKRSQYVRHKSSHRS